MANEQNHILLLRRGLIETCLFMALCFQTAARALSSVANGGAGDTAKRGGIKLKAHEMKYAPY